MGAMFKKPIWFNMFEFQDKASLEISLSSKSTIFLKFWVQRKARRGRAA